MTSTATTEAQRQPRSLQAEMECEDNSLDPEHQSELRQEVGRACRRLRELSSHLRRGEDDSGLQSDCDESMLVLNSSNDSEVSGSVEVRGQATPINQIFDRRDR